MARASLMQFRANGRSTVFSFTASAVPVPRRPAPPIDLEQPAEVRTATFALG